MLKLLTALTLLLALQGCIAYMPVKYVSEKFCEASPAKKEVLREEFDSGLAPYRVRVECPQVAVD